MVTLYLSQLILLLSEITSKQTNKLIEIKKAQEKFNDSNANQTYIITLNKSLKKQSKKFFLNKYSFENENIRNYNFKPIMPCLHVNETMRKKLIQVKILLKNA